MCQLCANYVSDKRVHYVLHVCVALHCVLVDDGSIVHCFQMIKLCISLLCVYIYIYIYIERERARYTHM